MEIFKYTAATGRVSAFAFKDFKGAETFDNTILVVLSGGIITVGPFESKEMATHALIAILERVSQNNL